MPNLSSAYRYRSVKARAKPQLLPATLKTSEDYEAFVQARMAAWKASRRNEVKPEGQRALKSDAKSEDQSEEMQI